MLGPLKNLFGKKSEYYLEIEDAKGTGVAPTPKAAPAAKPEAPKAVAAPAAKPAAPKAAATPAPAAPKAAATPAPAAPPKPAPAPQKAPEPVSGFATSYLMPNATTPRRRPGANMTSFLSMAQQVKTSKVK
ncbi:MAG TPA: hypothetical protein IGS52_14560 [Oscillatoriaceae cyanobacterium M33_DOE_052]|uniref:Uncharacterized protein n=1 Tax=Planktothricoides sp. SpSt-374 TaxID=2282167 RepID=A0A7C3VTJ5_9CYAN|nr:hypothetical protein [Oscillatoriaceae cyanobacterium M33_DOE_052]